jgi:two-component system, LuxR family, sensor kinase FixL
VSSRPNREPQSDQRALQPSADGEILSEGEARLRAVWEMAVDAMITIDERGIIEAVNPAALRLFGYAADEMSGKNVSMLMPSPDRERHNEYLQRYIETGIAKIIGIGREAIGVRKNGTEFPIDIAISELHVRGRRLFTGIIRDITDLRKAQRQLVQSERLTAIGQMVTGLAHESRNALQRAQACLDMLELEIGENSGSELLDLTRRGRAALDELHRLYEEVRDYASPVKLDYSTCDLCELVKTVWIHLEEEWATKQVQLFGHAEEKKLICQVDRHKIEQVLRNVLENAIAVSPQAGRVQVTCADADIDGRRGVRIAINDDGPGLDEKQKQGIFEPFFTTKPKGTGLGMAIARRLVEAHNGMIVVGHSPRSGAEIIISLPKELT